MKAPLPHPSLERTITVASRHCTTRSSPPAPSVAVPLLKSGRPFPRGLLEGPQDLRVAGSNGALDGHCSAKFTGAFDCLDVRFGDLTDTKTTPTARTMAAAATIQLHCH